jgi:glycosyltransferase involved in cell wall biosynthesis
MTTPPSISVVIPVYNGERYLGEAIESVLAQTVGGSEILVVDDGSTDGSAAVARRYPGVTVLQGPRQGIGAAMNRGISAARAELLTFLDADDLWTAAKLELQLARLAVESASALIFGMAVNFLSPDLAAETRQRFDAPGGPAPGLVSGALLMRRAAFERVGRFRVDLLVAGFIDWYARAEEMGMQRVVIPEVVLRRRVHGGNIGIRQPEARRDFVRVLKDRLDRRRSRW